MLTYCEAEYERRVADALVELYDRLREEMPQARFDFYQVGRPMGEGKES